VNGISSEAVIFIGDNESSERTMHVSVDRGRDWVELGEREDTGIIWNDWRANIWANGAVKNSSNNGTATTDRTGNLNSVLDGGLNQVRVVKSLE
jgi:hypothetical protein